ncbi:LmeA family phospholipid-binding protein [Arthrobacter sp. AL12]|uniref:LmeA family phospholipid-binding protein n=1 Tax=Arthrobacter sp. AL12 TaxID=3042241 RepID=UPI00249AD2C5|nr:LmeA family phospholipid-binding protein [Arthrobacter sp. AL12]MDI3213689.1 LmeA family phospholipid-binding protein [Arthrobacter sp. AL12]
MEWRRVKDWLIGAMGMVLVLGVMAAILWFAVGDPAAGGGAVPAPAPPAGVDRPPAAQPPAGLRDDEVWLADVALDAGTVVAAGSILRDVRTVGRDVVAGPDGLVAAQLAVDATVPFEVVANKLGDGTVVRSAGDGQVMVIRTVNALGRELPVTATGTVEVVAGRLIVEPRSIDLGGPDFLSDAIAAVVRGLVTIEHDIEGLPEGLVLQDVAVQDDGFRANLRGEYIKLVP